MTPGLARSALAALLASTACSTEPLPKLEAEPLMQEGAEADPRSREGMLGDFLAEYWRLPVPLQGDTPPGWSDAEASLDPAFCGACHPKQHAEWQTTLHAAAWSPGFAGQLVEGKLSRPRSLRHCQTCHAPLEEQQPVLASGEPQPAFDPELQRQGIVCAGCHARAHTRFGPPRRPELPAPAPEGRPLHGGFTPREEFQQARFCATCHQFFDREGPAGKPIENTYVEWRESSFAAEGRTCQSCHMPDRAHTWRGIHDREMVRSAVAIELVPADLSGEELTAALVLTSEEIGHAFPTYVTPRVWLIVWQSDGSDEIEGTRAETEIGRSVDFSVSPAEERFDTRVMPGESVRLDYQRVRARGATTLHWQVRVDPGHHYRGVYRSLLKRLSDPKAKARIAEALRREEQISYVLAEDRQLLPPRVPLRAQRGRE